MTKSDIIDRVATGTGLTKIETEAVINGFIAVVKAALRQGERVDLRGFGAFKVQHRAARTARNPRTREEIEVPPQYVPVFKASRELRQDVDEAMKTGKSEKPA
ncbi:MAG: DNA-binding protein [Rhodothermaceae bacterium]|uniref:HU family DNA-binding protein n=1 Tax=Rhodocaloribacter litoris TaxID=2558931 RepID=UPI001E3A1A2A|nr:HU family DNA-binding protein [Rhodocaloribacter litoris]GIV59365.1 MAG: DNA-binding protein [Rhodothermaceae bacterium]